MLFKRANRHLDASASCLFKIYLLIAGAVLLSACGGGDSGNDEPTQPVAQTQLLGAAENEEVDVLLTLSFTQKRAAKGASFVSTPSNTPQLLEFTALAPSGTALQGVLFFDDSQVQLEQSIETLLASKQVRLKAVLKKIQDKFVLAGTGSVQLGASASAEEQKLQDISWTMIALKQGEQFSGPEPGRVFHYYGAAEMKAVCDKGVVSSMYRIANTRKQTSVMGVLLGRLYSGKLCDASSFAGAARISMDAKVVSTRIGPLLISEGFVAPNGQFSNAVESFGLAIAEQIQGEGDIAEVTVTSDTRIIDAEAAAEFVGFYADYQALVFKSLKGNLQDLQVGDLIVSKPRPNIPNGFLRKVFQIETIKGYVAVRTENALISDILQEANIHVNRSYNQADVEEAYRWYGAELPDTIVPPTDAVGGVSMVASKAAKGNDLISINVNKVIFDGDDDDSTTDDQVKVTGSLTFTPGVVLDLVCSGTLCSKPDFTAKFVLDEETSAKLTGSIKKTLHKSFNLPPSIWLPPITVGPLVFTPKFVIQLNVDGSVSASITYEATQTFTLEAGVDYNPNDGWGTISVFDKGFDNSPPVYEGAIDAKAELAVRGEFKLYGLAGVFADLGGYVQFQAQYPSDPSWELFGGYGSSVGVDLDVIILSAQYEWDIFDKRWSIAFAPNTPPSPPEISQPYPKTATKVEGFILGDDVDKFVQVNADVTIDVSAWDDQTGEKGSLIVITDSLEGNIGSVKSAEQTGLVHAFTSEGLHTLTAVATDEGGNGLASEASTISFEVIDSKLLRIDAYPPEFSIDRPEVVYEDQPTDIVLSVVDTRNNQELPLKVLVDWSVDGTYIRTTGGDASNPMQHTFRYSFSTAAKPTRANKSDISGNDLTQSDTAPDAFKIKTSSNILATIQYEYEGSGGKPFILTKQTKVKIAPTQGGKIIATLSPVSKTFTTDHRPVGIGEDVIYSVTVDHIGQCNVGVVWSSSDDRDDIGLHPVSTSFVGDTATITLNFHSTGSRNITAELAAPDCFEVASKVETRVQRYLGEGDTPNTGNYQFSPDSL